MFWYGIFIVIIIFSIVIQQNFTLKFKLSTPIFSLIAIFFVLLIVLRPSTLPDYGSYYDFYTRSNLNHESFEFFSHIIRIISPGWYFFLFIFALLSISLKLYAIKLNTDKHILAILTYISTSFVLHDFIQIRVSCAIGIIWVALYYLTRRKILIYLILISLASLFHVSSMVFFPMVILKADKINKFFWFLLIVLSYLLAIFNIDLIGLFLSLLKFDNHIINKVTIYYKLAQDLKVTHGYVNIFAVNQLIKIIIFVLVLIKFHKFDKNKILLIKIYTIGICVLPIFSNVSAISLRFSELLTSVIVFILPDLFSLFKNKMYGYLAYLLLISCSFFLNVLYPNYFNV